MIVHVLILFLLGTVHIDAYSDDYFFNERDDFNRQNPDALLNGYFPLWGGVLIILAGVFLVTTILGLIGYFVGCRTPRDERHPSTDSTTPFFVVHNLPKTV